jgi:hypothetical protein
MSKIAILREAQLELLHEHERDDALPTSARFLFYELVSRGVVSKERQGARRRDQDAGEALTQLREQGEVPWDWIVDETRTLENYSGSTSIREAMLEHLPNARLDPWQGKIILVLTESRSLAGALRSIAWRYRIRIASTNGQCGGFLHTTIVPLLMNGDAAPQLLYLGDYDLSGNQIEANTRRVLEQEAGELDCERIALTAEQVEEHDLPIIVKHDHRYKDGCLHQAVETDALNQRVIIELLQGELNARLPEPLERVHERERRQRRAIEKLLRSSSNFADKSPAPPTTTSKQTKKEYRK